MIHFRVICAILMAWSMNWALGLPEAEQVLVDMPQMEIIAVIVGALIGAFSLAARQGWGLIVALANGVWAGILSVALSGFALVAYIASQSLGVVSSFDRWMVVVEGDLEPVWDNMLNFPLLLMTLAATAVVGLVTEVIHWALVRIKKNRGDWHEDKGTTTKRGNTQELW